LILDQTVNVSVENNGDVSITFNRHDKDDDKDVNINIYAGEFKKGVKYQEKYNDFNTEIVFDKFAKVRALQ